MGSCEEEVGAQTEAQPGKEARVDRVRKRKDPGSEKEEEENGENKEEKKGKEKKEERKIE